MKGVNSFDENGYWSRYSNDNWSVCKIYDDVLGYEYTLSGERFNALEIVDKLASLEAENAKLREQTRWIPVSEKLPEIGFTGLCQVAGNGYVIARYAPYDSKEGWTSDEIGYCEVTHYSPLPPAPESEG